MTIHWIVKLLFKILIQLLQVQHNSLHLWGSHIVSQPVFLHKISSYSSFYSFPLAVPQCWCVPFALGTTTYSTKIFFLQGSPKRPFATLLDTFLLMSTNLCLVSPFLICLKQNVGGWNCIFYFLINSKRHTFKISLNWKLFYYKLVSIYLTMVLLCRKSSSKISHLWHCAVQSIAKQILEHSTHFEMYLFVCHLLSILESFAGSFI